MEEKCVTSSELRITRDALIYEIKKAQAILTSEHSILDDRIESNLKEQSVVLETSRCNMLKMIIFVQGLTILLILLTNSK